jgi:molybdate-binding protein
VSDGEIKSTVDLAGDDPDTQKIPLKIVNQMLVFLETGTCDALSASSDKLGFRTKLLVLAQMYSLERLKNATVASVVSNLTPSSAPVVAVMLKKRGVLWQTDCAAPVNELKRYFRE